MTDDRLKTVEGRAALQQWLADIPTHYPESETERRNHVGQLEALLEQALDEIDRLREDLSSCLSDDEGWAEQWKALALKRQEERDEARAELSAIREVLDNAPTPSLNTDRTPSTLAERVEWLVWAWQGDGQ